MYSNDERHINWLDILIKIAFGIIFVLLLVWLFPKVPNMTPFYSNVFRENIKYMQEAGESYFTNERLPKEIGGSVKLTLEEMYNKNLVLPFVDKDGQSCNVYSSYVEVTKESKDEYSLKTSLVCNDEQNYVKKVLGCYDYCEDCEEEKEKALEYQHKKAVSTSYNKYTCPAGYTLNGTYCYKSIETSTEAQISYNQVKKYTNSSVAYTGDKIEYVVPIVSTTTTSSCPSGYTRNGNECYKYETTSMIPGTSTSSCPSGYTQNGSTCVKTVYASLITSSTSSCPSGYSETTDGRCYREDVTRVQTSTSSSCPSGYSETSDGRCYYKDEVSLDTSVSSSCPSGYTRDGNSCSKKVTTSLQTSSSSSCPSGYTKNGNTCSKKVTTSLQTSSSTTCPSGYSKSGSTCAKTVTTSKESKKIYNGTTTEYVCTSTSNCPGIVEVPHYTYVYSCPSGYTESGSSCSKTVYTSPTTSSSSSCPSGYTKDGNSCYKYEYTSPTTSSSSSCPSGYTQSGNSCYKYEYTSLETSSNSSCPSGYTQNGNSCYKYVYTSKTGGTTTYCPSGYTQSGNNCYKYTYINKNGGTTSYCPSGYTQSGNSCYKTESTALQTNTTLSYCPSGYSALNGSCYKYIYSGLNTQTNSIYSCPAGYTQSINGQSMLCTKTTQGSSYNYCPAGQTLEGDKCYTVTTQESYSCASGVKNGNKCIVSTQTKVEASSTKVSGVSYQYKWSSSKTLEGWIFTGNTREV